MKVYPPLISIFSAHLRVFSSVVLLKKYWMKNKRRERHLVVEFHQETDKLINVNQPVGRVDYRGKPRHHCFDDMKLGADPPFRPVIHIVFQSGYASLA